MLPVQQAGQLRQGDIYLSRDRRSLRLALARVAPVARQSCAQRTAVAAAIPKRSAAAGHNMPP
jgi:hypothetical protein